MREIATFSEPFRLARSMASMDQSTLREVLGLVSRPGILSMAVGLPAPELFPMEGLARAAASLLPSRPESMQYGIPYEPLKHRIVELMAARGVRCRAEQVFLTSGSQQGMVLLTQLLLDPGGTAMIEETVYDGIQMAIKRMGPEILTVPTDPDTGIDVDAVEALLAGGARPAFLYTITDGHNPLGVSISPEKRPRLAELARAFGVPILEDDAYGFLFYGDDPPPPLKALEDRWVFYLGSFSKILAPGLRAGWIVVPEELIPRISALKHAADLDTPAFSHYLIEAWLDSEDLAGHLALLRTEYRRRRDTLLAALDAHFPEAVRWNRPQSGMFVWVELPREIDAADLLRTAVETERVGFTPGMAFAAGRGTHASHCLRLSFSNCAPEVLEEGVRRLSRVVRAAVGE